MCSLAMLRSLSAGPSRSSDKNIESLEPLEIKWKKPAIQKPDFSKYQAFLTGGLQFGTDANMSTAVNPVQFSNENVSSGATDKVSV